MKIKIRKIYLLYIKRFIGIVCSVLGLLFLWPVMLGIGIAIKKDSKGNIIFKQKRLGRFQKIFTIYKFRTMVPGAYEAGGAKSYDGDPRITRVGAILRKTSLDELPQIINILKGEMSIIGPRPILAEEFEEYTEDTLYEKRFKVNPGLFCSVDLKYRAAASREIQFKMDADYAEHVSFFKDAKIFIYIITKVLKQENIYPDTINPDENNQDEKNQDVKNQDEKIQDEKNQNVKNQNVKNQNEKNQDEKIDVNNENINTKHKKSTTQLIKTKHFKTHKIKQILLTIKRLL